MITCSRCGAGVPAGLASCQKCGTPIDGVPGKGNQDQPALPAWLETLRADRRPAPAPSSSPFPALNMPEEDAVPDWMRSGSLEGGDATPPGSFPAPRPASTPAPNTDGVYMQANMPANSLIDEQSLPSWLREAQGAGPRTPQENIAGSSLIQQESLPNWMRTMPPAPTPSQSAPSASPQPSQPITNMPPQGPIAGSDLIDPQALPQWMTNQPGSGVPAQGERFSASSLLDASALPPWMRDAGQQQPPARPPSFPPNAPAQPAQAAPMPQGPVFNGQPPTMPGQNMYEQPPQPGSGLAANSLIDMNALPDWLRSAEGQQRYPNQPPQPGMPAPFSGPGRAGNMRVPGRPRSDMGVGPQEDSAVAANVFSSVLGVASAAPFFPAPGQGPVPAPPQPVNGAAPATFAQGTQPPQGSAPGQGMGAYPAYPVPPSSGQLPAGYQGNMNPNMQPGGMLSFPGTGPGMQPESSATREPTKPAKPARRSIFDALRDWLSR